jgi:hypothetical protein
VPLRFNQLLVEAGIVAADVRLLRHQTNLGGGRSLIEAWRTDRPAFEAYQALQLTAKRSSFTRPYWASFLGTWDGRTLFGGLYAASAPVTIDKPVVVPLTGTVAPAGSVDRFTTQLTGDLADYAGRLYIDWGGGSSGKRSWNQRADVQDKQITELHLDQTERPFPGLMAIATPLSVIGEAPPGWVQRLAEARGVYLLACPRTGELYVGSATGAGGFWSRWEEYRRNGHGGNVALVGREPTDWRVSVLQVAGSVDSGDDILAMEAAWKVKLQAREFGLCRN